MLDAGLIVITAFISPFEEERTCQKFSERRKLFSGTCKLFSRKVWGKDVKGLYKKARAGEIKNFTGIDSPYEIPNKPNLIVDTEKESVSESVDKIFSAISNKIK